MRYNCPLTGLLDPSSIIWNNEDTYDVLPVDWSMAANLIFDKIYLCGQVIEEECHTCNDSACRGLPSAKSRMDRSILKPDS